MTLRFDDQTYYEILEISPDAPEHEIHRAYQKAKKTYSPDSPALYTMFTPDEAIELTKLIEEAYTVLSNHAARRDYDSRLLGRQPETKPSSANAKRTASPTQTTQPQSRPTPEGYARTRLGAYEVNEDFEEELRQAENFDGELLRRVRNYKNINLESLSQEIRVSRTYLHALEQEDYSSLPADVFVRGFVVQYAKAVGLMPEKVAKSYMKKLKDAKQG